MLTREKNLSAVPQFKWRKFYVAPNIAFYISITSMFTFVPSCLPAFLSHSTPGDQVWTLNIWTRTENPAVGVCLFVCFLFISLFFSPFCFFFPLTGHNGNNIYWITVVIDHVKKVNWHDIINNVRSGPRQLTHKDISFMFLWYAFFFSSKETETLFLNHWNLKFSVTLLTTKSCITAEKEAQR